MDAQNAAEPASSKLSASPKRSAATTEADQPKSTVSRPTTAPRISSPGIERDRDRNREAKVGRQASNVVDDGNGGDVGADGNSDAETIVLPGKDGQPSPSKARKVIKHEARSDAEGSVEALTSGRKQSSGSNGGNRSGGAGGGSKIKDGEKSEQRLSGAVTGPGSSEAVPSLSEQNRKKRLSDKQRGTNKDASSGLSSAPASPPQQRRRRLSTARSDSDSDSAQPKSPKSSSTVKDKARSVDRLVSHKRKAPRPDSDDEGENRKARRQRTASSGAAVEVSGQNRAHRDNRTASTSKAHHDAYYPPRTRSTSPHPRNHRRSISTRLPSQSSNGLSHKKKRVPAPLHSTDYNSDESSASGSPHVRNAKLRRLTTPAAPESNLSPAKMAPHKKHLDAHGQTLLARACARGEYDSVKQRLQERPEDLNVADYAGNTPLQISSLHGFDEIVKLLIEAGCHLECMNNDRDTPLLDAVDNGHLEVVKLLLEAGVNPRKANVNGEEPLDRLSDDLDNADEMRKVLIEAKQKMGERRQTSEEHHREQDARSSHGPDSPRHSPAAASSQIGSTSRRTGTVRSTKTSNHLLYMPMDDKTLRQAAGRGDEETVTRILQVRDKFNDPESMVAAARGGHDIVMQLLLALGNANPDPAPITSMPPEMATPILAAIGQENIKVIRLLLDQNDFDPTRRFKGETYYEIARRRQGTNWKEEEQMLKDAFDAYRKSRKDASKTKSPNRREQDREARRAARTEREEEPRPHKRPLSSPSREQKKSGPGKVSTSPKQKRRSDSFSANQDDRTSPKRGPVKPKRDDRLSAITGPDREHSPSASRFPGKPRRADSDMAAISSEGETMKPRRKLISGKDLKGEREKQRRASLASNASSLRDPSSPLDSRHDDTSERPKTEKYHDRAKALKRDDSRDRFAQSGDGSSKRHRSSATPPHNGSSEKEGEAPLKKRRIDTDGKEKRKLTSLSNDRPNKAPLSREASRTSSKEQDDAEKKDRTKAKKPEVDHTRRESGKSYTSDRSIHVKSEDTDVEMRDMDRTVDDDDSVITANRQKEEREKRQAQLEAEALETKKKEDEERRKREEDEKRLREEAEAKQRAEEEKRRAEEDERKRKEEEERKRKEEEERKAKEKQEAERRRLEEEKRRQQEEQERLLREAEKKRKQEEERERKRREEEQKRQEEERLRQLQLEREAAEAARRKREEEERKEKERLMREEMERRRAAKEAEQRRIFLEQERIRLEKLPPLLRWLDGYANPKTPALAAKFARLQGVRCDCIRSETKGTSDGREQWLLNTQVALLLGEKDLNLSRYTAWERIRASDAAKQSIWRVEGDRYTLLPPDLYEMGRQLSDYYCGQDPDSMNYRLTEKLRGEAWKNFAALDMFFVKVSDLMYIVPNIPHLRNVKITVVYREIYLGILPSGPPKWKSDPGAGPKGPPPPNKIYLNGEVIGEEVNRFTAFASKTEIKPTLVPRRGFVQVRPDDPDYAKLCKEQGLQHLLNGGGSPGVLSSSNPAGSAAGTPVTQENGSPIQSAPTTLNSNGEYPSSSSTTSPVLPNGFLPNGVHDSSVDKKY